MKPLKKLILCFKTENEYFTSFLYYLGVLSQIKCIKNAYVLTNVVAYNIQNKQS